MDHDHGGGDEGSESMHMMAMYFRAGYKETILFKGWETTNVGEFIGSAIAIFLLALIYEGLKFYREYLFEQTSPPATTEYTNYGLLGGIKRNVFKQFHLVQTLLHMLQLVLSYFLMLIFMTYNVWLAIAITSGAGVGYLLFGWNKRSAVDVTEHCH